MSGHVRFSLKWPDALQTPRGVWLFSSQTEKRDTVLSLDV